MTRIHSSFVVVLLVALVLGVPTAHATVVGRCGDTITEDFTFDADLDCTGNGLEVGADKVTIDLNGFTLSGDGSGFGILVPGFDKVTIENGMIEDFNVGINVTGDAQKLKVTDVTVFASTNAGIDLNDSDAGKVKGCLLNGNGDAGLIVGLDGTDNKIEKTTAVGNGGGGFEVFGDDNVLKKVVTTINSQGILLAGDRNEATSCTVLRNTDHGVEIQGDGNEVSKCDVGGNHVEGICVRTGLGNEVEKNAVLGNRQNGILVTDADDTVVKKNDVHGNELDGIKIEADSDDVVVDGNECIGNHTDGIDTENASATIKKNDASANGELGIEADGGAIDGGGNKASNNADGGCTGVVCK